MKLRDVAPTVNNPSSNSESTDGNASGLTVDGVTQNNNDGDVETDDLVDADNGFEVNEDEPASGDKNPRLMAAGLSSSNLIRLS